MISKNVEGFIGATDEPEICVKDTASEPWPHKPSALLVTSNIKISPSEAIPLRDILSKLELSIK